MDKNVCSNVHWSIPQPRLRFAGIAGGALLGHKHVAGQPNRLPQNLQPLQPDTHVDSIETVESGLHKHSSQATSGQTVELPSKQDINGSNGTLGPQTPQTAYHAHLGGAWERQRCPKQACVWRTRLVPSGSQLPGPSHLHQASTLGADELSTLVLPNNQSTIIPIFNFIHKACNLSSNCLEMFGQLLPRHIPASSSTAPQ